MLMQLETLTNLPDESLAPCWVLDQRAEPLRSLVPAADGQHGLEVLVVGLQGRKPTVATWVNTGEHSLS